MALWPLGGFIPKNEERCTISDSASSAGGRETGNGGTGIGGRFMGTGRHSACAVTRTGKGA